MSGFKLLDDSNKRDTPEGAVRSSVGASDHPLGLTVHSIPSPGGPLEDGSRRPGAGRWKMLAVFLVCAAPVMASYFMYYVVRPEGRRNFGELIEPQRPLPDQPGVSLAGASVNLKNLRGQWLLVSVSSGACDDACNRHLFLQRQLREGLGKDKDRVDWVWLIQDDAPVPAALMPGLKDATVWRVSASELAKWLQPAKGHPIEDHLYVVDPIGHWMMRFPAILDLDRASQAKKDIERLLRASASWDQPGRQIAK